MQFRTSTPEDEPHVNLTPLIDVVFLLLIFFMISTTFKRESELNVDLPKASAQPAEAKKDSINLIIDRQGRFFVNRRMVVNSQVTTLMSALRKVIGEGKDISLTISADAMTPHQYVITAMDAARQLGITKLSMATQNTNAESKARR
jgi:biopolymer transport protein ExbD